MIAQLLGAMAGKAMDPVTWVVVVLAISVAALKHAWWWPLIAAALGAIVVALVVSRNAALIGMPADSSRTWFAQFVLIGAWSQLAYWCARAVRYFSGAA